MILLRSETRYYPKEGLNTSVRKQLDHFLGIHNMLPQIDRDLIAPFLERILKSRTKRAREISSPEYIKILDKLMLPKEKGGYFNFPDIFGVDCIDGRVVSPLLAGLVARFFGVIRTPAGDLSEFEKRSGNGTVLLEGSDFAKRLMETFDNRNTDYITQIYDSHVECKARGNLEEKRLGYKSPDHGLFVDVVRKKAMAQATKDYVTEHGGGNKKVDVIQLSFNPETGSLYMGLDTDKALDAARKKGGMFFDNSEAEEEIPFKERKNTDFNLLDELAESGDIISTEHLVKKASVISALEPHGIALNWESDYVGTAKKFWEKIAELQKTDLYQNIQKKLSAIYPDIAKQEKDDRGKKEIEDRATIVLANLFSVYCFTRDGKTYPYAKHIEEIANASRGGISPYSEIPAFGISIHDLKNIAANAKLAYNIILGNRKEKRVHTRKDAPVVLTVQHMIRTSPSDPIWREINKINFQSLPDITWEGEGNTWLYMDDDQFKKCMKTNFNIKNEGIIEELNSLRKAIIALYLDKDQKNPLPYLFPQFPGDDPDKTDRPPRPRLIILPVLTDEHRAPMAIIPFTSNNVKGLKLKKEHN